MALIWRLFEPGVQELPDPPRQIVFHARKEWIGSGDLESPRHTHRVLLFVHRNSSIRVHSLSAGAICPTLLNSNNPARR
jgi:hypothetical protein